MRPGSSGYHFVIPTFTTHQKAIDIYIFSSLSEGAQVAPSCGAPYACCIILQQPLCRDSPASWDNSSFQFLNDLVPRPSAGAAQEAVPVSDDASGSSAPVLSLRLCGLEPSLLSCCSRCCVAPESGARRGRRAMIYGALSIYRSYRAGSS